MPPPQPASSLPRQASIIAAWAACAAVVMSSPYTWLELASRSDVIHMRTMACMLQTASAGVVDTKALPKLTYEFDALEPYVSFL